MPADGFSGKQKGKSMKKINMETFSNGELSHQINRELEAVAKNIADPNTDATAARKIQVTITMKPNEQRNFITTAITTKSTFAPVLGAVTAITVEKDLETGEIQVAEIGNQIPGQMSVEDVIPPATTVIDGKAVDTETGEILGDVIDLRKREA